MSAKTPRARAASRKSAVAAPLCAGGSRWKRNKGKAKVPLASQVSICHVEYDSIHADKISHIELARNGHGCLKYVKPIEGGRFYETSYFNAELNKTIKLGSYSDMYTASLAHGLARTNLVCRSVDYAAQGFVERLFAQHHEPVPDKEAHVPALATSTSSGGARDGLDLLDLFSG
jgi:hypothetical protein